MDKGIVLFFGGPAAGKRTTLHELARRWTPSADDVPSLRRIAVWLDLTQAPVFTSGAEFYLFALKALARESIRRVPGLVLPSWQEVATAQTPCHWFFAQVRALVKANRTLDFKFLLIVHRADYLLNRPYSNEFERNMVSVFRHAVKEDDGNSLGRRSKIGLVLSGGGKLYAQSHNYDSHSPLRGIKARAYCQNLSSDAVRELTRGVAGDDADQAWVSLAAEIVDAATGGQADLAVRFAQALVARGPLAGDALRVAGQEVFGDLRAEAGEAFRSAREDLRACGPYTDVGLEALRGRSGLDVPSLRDALEKAGKDATLWQHAMESISMCGFARYDDARHTLTRCNEFFWEHLRAPATPSPVPDALAPRSLEPYVVREDCGYLVFEHPGCGERGEKVRILPRYRFLLVLLSTPGEPFSAERLLQGLGESNLQRADRGSGLVRVAFRKVLDTKRDAALSRTLSFLDPLVKRDSTGGGAGNRRVYSYTGPKWQVNVLRWTINV